MAAARARSDRRTLRKPGRRHLHRRDRRVGVRGGRDDVRGDRLRRSPAARGGSGLASLRATLLAKSPRVGSAGRSTSRRDVERLLGGRAARPGTLWRAASMAWRTWDRRLRCRGGGHGRMVAMLRPRCLHRPAGQAPDILEIPRARRGGVEGGDMRSRPGALRGCAGRRRNRRAERLRFIQSDRAASDHRSAAGHICIFRVAVRAAFNVAFREPSGAVARPGGEPLLRHRSGAADARPGHPVRGRLSPRVQPGDRRERHEVAARRARRKAVTTGPAPTRSSPSPRPIARRSAVTPCSGTTSCQTG